MNTVRRLSAQRRIFELNKAADQELEKELDNLETKNKKANSQASRKVKTS